MRKLALVAAVGVGVGVAVGSASGQLNPLPALIHVVQRSCLFCSVQYVMDVAGCEDDGSLDEEAAECRAWAFQEFRRCARGCWDEENLPELLMDLWERGELTSDQMVEVLLG